MKKKLKAVLVFENLLVACFNEQGEQVPQLQESLLTLWAERAEKLGYDVNGLVINSGFFSYRIERTAEGFVFEPV